MAKRTYNRQPQSVGMDYYEKQGLSDRYLNFNEFHGLNTNKNYLAIDQQSFADCNNVYVDQDGELAARPPVKYKTINIIPSTETILSIKKIENVLFYHTFDGNKYYLRSSYLDSPIETVENLFICWVQSWFVLFEQTNKGVKLSAFNKIDNKVEFYDSDIIFTPSIISTIASSSSPDKNILTTSQYNIYIVDTIDEIPSNLQGKSIIISIDNVEYTLTYSSYTRYILTTPVRYSSLDVDWDTVQISVATSGDAYYFVVINDIMYISFDGSTFISIINGPSDGFGDANVYRSYKLCEVNDGTTVALWIVTRDLRNSNNTCKVYRAMVGPTSLPSQSSWSLITNVTVPAQGPMTYADANSTPRGVCYMQYNNSGQPFESTVSFQSIFGYVKSYALHSPSSTELLFLTPLSCDIAYYRFLAVGGTSLVYRSTDDANLLTMIDTSSSSISKSYVLIDLFLQSDPNFQSTVHLSYCHLYKDIVVVSNINSVLQFTFTRGNNGIVTELCTAYMVFGANESPLYCFNRTGHSFNIENATYYTFSKQYLFYDNNDTGMAANYASLPVRSVISSTSLEDYKGFYCKTFVTPNEQYNSLLTYTTPIWRELLPSAPFPKPEIAAKEYILRNIGTFAYTSWYLDNTDVYIDNFNYDRTSNTSTNRTRYQRRTYIPAYFNRANIGPAGTGPNQAIEIFNNNTSFAGKYAINTDGNVLSKQYLYIAGETLLLLDRGTDNNTPISINDNNEIRYYDPKNEQIFATGQSYKMYVKVFKKGNETLFKPDLYIDGYKRAFSKDNKLYVLSDTDIKGQLYIKEVNVFEFTSNITALINLSSTSIAIFLQDSVWILFENNGMNLIKSKLQLGNRQDNDVINIYDGSSILLPTLNGLTSLSYEQFVQSTDQVYKYLSEQIMDNFDAYFEGNIKLKQYKRWIFMYRQDLNYLFLYDISLSCWWKWTLPYPLQNLEYDNENGLLLLLNNKICNFDLTYSTFVDFVDSKINWNIVTQKLHFNAPNNYKHIRAVNVITTQKGGKIRYKLKYKNYRNIDNTEEDDVREFIIETLTTTINRVAFIKTNAFQVEISNDKTDGSPAPFITPGISVKYRITEKIR